jgi:ribosomal protein S18 acetylase RimI-like enzyme
MIFSVRKAYGEDAHYIIDIDIKCFDDPWPPEYWVSFEDLQVYVATYYGTPIAMVAFMVGETEKGIKFVSLSKLAVKPAFRGRGVSKMLLAQAEKFAKQINAHSIWLTVPESLCVGERSIAGWLKLAGFRATSVQPECFESYGEPEDGYSFQYTL